MNRYYLLSAAYFLSSALFAATPPAPKTEPVVQGVDVGFTDKQQEVDMDALRRWLQDKRLTSLKELGGDLSISGEVRTECQYTNEKRKDQGSDEFIKQRGMGSATSKPNLAWDVECNLMIDYHTDRTWAAMKIEFDNDMGIRSGTVNKVRLEKAYLGGRVIAGDTFTFDAEIGRRYLSNAFDSRLEFGSLFDGSLFRLSKAFEEIGDFYSNIGIFLVDDRFNHYGEVLELGALKIANTGWAVKYSIINWYRHFSQAELGKTEKSPQHRAQPWRFLVNQLLTYYQVYPEWFGKRLFKVYAASLINPMARASERTFYARQNLGWYAGVSLGLVKKAGDWAIDASYQWAQPQVAPSTDCSGISRGNAQSSGFYTIGLDGTGLPTTSANAVGSFNFRGFAIDALYAFTNNLTVEQQIAMSWTLDPSIGPNIKFKNYEVEFIYAF